MVLVLWSVGSILRNWYGILGQKVCCIASGKGDVSRVTLQEYNIRYILLQHSYINYMSVAKLLARQSLTTEDRVCFPEGHNIYQLINPGFVNFLL